MSPADLYDDDDLADQHDGYEDGDEELSPEDRASMSKGTAEVQKALGNVASKVTVTQIQEALWHYYYDVEKSVGYLKRTFITPTPKQSAKKTPEAFSEPSPDDIVLAAQAKAGKKTAAAPKAVKKTPAEDAKKQTELSNGVSGLKVNDAPPPKSKGLDVIKEFESSQVKKSTSFVVVGHVDAGKSTLMGRLLLELKFIEQRTVDKYRRQAEKAGKQSFALAWVMDQGSEERDRGVTIDIATNHFETPTTKFTILDAPGHRDFVPNMIAGASQADLAILVVDANTVNKLDMVGWSKERFDEISEQVSGFLTGLGFQGKHVSFIPISGLNGDNIAGKIGSAAASWYKGSTLMEALEATGPSSTRALRKAFRMPISEVFRSQQGTTTLAGRIDSGTVQVGDSVILQPSGESAYIKSIMVDTDAQDWAVAGQSVSIALSNIDPIHIRVGDIVCDAKDPIKCGDTFTMKAMAFDHVMPMPVDLHRGRLHAPGQIQSISAILDKTTGEVIKKKPKVVQPGGVARMLIRLNGKVALEAGHRVVIRSGGETIAAGLLE
ncbi:elongation factor tu GTP binding domain-containing protein [Hirsutella rhossiliensis]|uniref:Elongation factor tu GTP binding domain-containing protein n=1 Tax=Hirsutella rhossiliensis TaxID=111463 RepID=A0A9P8MM40_9HYPO|nr:elongation factor tu GTP binding domain-containing protein [Hirsutella rhossiliensis]KAH0958738.1 elongation factor tu GTP binding domain-containing protein [Hirsutella rhossiliensis]